MIRGSTVDLIDGWGTCRKDLLWQCFGLYAVVNVRVAGISSIMPQHGILQSSTDMLFTSREHSNTCMPDICFYHSSPRAVILEQGVIRTILKRRKCASLRIKRLAGRHVVNQQPKNISRYAKPIVVCQIPTGEHARVIVQ